jgi:hypothetical protein
LVFTWGTLVLPYGAPRASKPCSKKRKLYSIYSLLPSTSIVDFLPPGRLCSFIPTPGSHFRRPNLSWRPPDLAQYPKNSLGDNPCSLLLAEIGIPFSFTKSIKGVQPLSSSSPLLLCSQMVSFLAVVRVLLFSFLVSAVVASGNKCKKPKVRREWRALSRDQRTEWIRAVNVFNPPFSCSSRR